MEIIKPGCVRGAWSAECTCSYCGSILKVQEMDLKRADASNGPYVAYFYCCACNYRNIISVPSIVVARLRARW